MSLKEWVKEHDLEPESYFIIVGLPSYMLLTLTSVVTNVILIMQNQPTIHLFEVSNISIAVLSIAVLVIAVIWCQIAGTQLPNHSYKCKIIESSSMTSVYIFGKYVITSAHMFIFVFCAAMFCLTDIPSEPTATEAAFETSSLCALLSVTLLQLVFVVIDLIGYFYKLYSQPVMAH